MKHKLQNLLKHKLQWLLLLAALLGVSQGVWGATETTLYYAISSGDVGSYTVKANVNRKGDGDDWATYTMTDTGKTYYGKKLYSCAFTDLYDGLGCIQFQLYDGSTQKSQYQPFGTKDWHSASTYNGKICVKDDSTWKEYTYDKTATIKVAKDGAYKTITPKLYAWENSDDKLLGNYGGESMTSGSGFWYKAVTYHASSFNIIINNNNSESEKTSDINSISSDKCYSVAVGYTSHSELSNSSPTVTTPTSSDVTSSGATLGGNLTNKGSYNCSTVLTGRGVKVWENSGCTGDPDFTFAHATADASTGTFTVTASGLSAGTTYYYKAYASNDKGTGLSEKGTFTTTASCSNPNITTQPSGSWQKCGNDTGRELSITATGGSGTLTYQWYRNTTNTLTDGVADLTGATAVTDMVEGGNTYSPSASDYGVFYYCCVVRSGGACSANKATSVYTGAIEIKQTPTVKPSTITVKQYEPVKLNATNSSVNWSITSYPGGAAADEYYLYDETKSSAMFKGKTGSTGSYTITATSTGSDCTSTSTVTVEDDPSEGC